MTDAEFYFRHAAINATIAEAAKNRGDFALAQFCAERAIYFLAKGFEALALQSGQAKN